jgi:DNA-binding transcriptional MerR regulator
MNIEIEIEDIAYSVNRREALELIRILSKRFTEVDFPIQVIKNLLKSLKSDLSDEEIKKLLEL